MIRALRCAQGDNHSLPDCRVRQPGSGPAPRPARSRRQELGPPGRAACGSPALSRHTLCDGARGMSRTAAGLRSDPTTRLAEVARRRPEWQGWIGLLDVARRAMDGGRWPLALTPARISPSASRREPLLHNRTLRVDAGRAQSLIEELAFTAGEIEGGRSLRGLRVSRADSLALMSSAIIGNTHVIQLLATQQDVDPAALDSLAHMAALPLLQACSQQLQSLLPTTGPKATVRSAPPGRCWRSGGGWIAAAGFGADAAPPTGRSSGSTASIVASGTTGSSAHSRPMNRGSCSRWRPARPAMGISNRLPVSRAFLPLELLLQDLETVELDLVALERGYHRPQTSAFPLALQLTDDAAGAGL